jgi:hypothetical protein
LCPGYVIGGAEGWQRRIALALCYVVFLVLLGVAVVVLAALILFSRLG